MTVVESLREELEVIRKRKGTETLALIKKAVDGGITVHMTVRSQPENRFADRMMQQLLREKYAMVKVISVVEASPSDCLIVDFEDICG